MLPAACAPSDATREGARGSGSRLAPTSVAPAGFNRVAVARRTLFLTRLTSAAEERRHCCSGAGGKHVGEARRLLSLITGGRAHGAAVSAERSRQPVTRGRTWTS
jgi:hypothetical protein